jgi:hypothetical protein
VAIVIRNEMGADLVRGEDSPNTLDPVLEYTVPDKVSFIQVVVQDVAGRGNARGIYRLVVSPNNITQRLSSRRQKPLKVITK